MASLVKLTFLDIPEYSSFIAMIASALYPNKRAHPLRRDPHEAELVGLKKSVCLSMLHDGRDGHFLLFGYNVKQLGRTVGFYSGNSRMFPVQSHLSRNYTV